MNTQSMMSMMLILMISLQVTPFTPKRIAVLGGAGHVGIVTGVCLAQCGHIVICADNASHKIALLQNGIAPIYESHLEELILINTKNRRLTFTDKVSEAVVASEILMIAVDTPLGEAGKANTQQLFSLLEYITPSMTDYKLLCIKSTIPLGCEQEIKKIMQQHEVYNYDLAVNPEFLREGSAVNDFMNPQRLIFGTESKRSLNLLLEIYTPLIKNNIPYITTTIPSASMIKYASNCFLAVKLAYTNEIAQLCESLGADIQAVTHGMGLDTRIGKEYLSVGPGFGGACLPKDTQELLATAHSHNVELHVVKGAIEANKNQVSYLLDKIRKKLGGTISGKTITLLGISFKAYTNDVRNSPSLALADMLLTEGAIIKAYDPLVNNLQRDTIAQFSCLEDAVKGADALVIMTEDKLWQSLDFSKIKQLMLHTCIIDARNIIASSILHEQGIDYTNIGNASVKSTLQTLHQFTETS
jgi:UDPglucose 6-dehydrogenase